MASLFHFPVTNVCYALFPENQTMGLDSDHRRAVAKYFANPQLDALAAAEGLAPDLTVCYRAWRTALFHRAFALVQDHATAEDLMQEAFLRLVTEIKRGGLIRSALHWTSKVLRNIALNHLEHKRVVYDLTLDGVDLEALEVPHRTPNAEQSLISREREAALGAALARLNSKERDCLSLFAEGHSYQGIAKELQIPFGTAAALVRKGLRRIRKEMEANGHE
jgi:RNA polymerase sigma-70 factor (ECF subfamily)